MIEKMGRPNLGAAHFDYSPCQDFDRSIMNFIDRYSGFDSALYRNEDTMWHFSQEDATSREIKMAALESKPL